MYTDDRCYVAIQVSMNVSPDVESPGKGYANSCTSPLHNVDERELLKSFISPTEIVISQLLRDIHMKMLYYITFSWA